jgi:hypothetical protein
MQILFGGIQHRLEVFMILTGKRLGGENHLMFRIDQPITLPPAAPAALRLQAPVGRNFINYINPA